MTAAEKLIERSKKRLYHGSPGINPNDFEKLIAIAETAMEELDFLAFKRERCKHHECCGECGEIYSAEKAIIKIQTICEKGAD